MTVQIKKSPIIYTYRIIQITENRVGAKLVSDYMMNITPADQYKLLELTRMSMSGERDRGTGRPTKKERRRCGFLRGERNCSVSLLCAEQNAVSQYAVYAV